MPVEPSQGPRRSRGLEDIAPQYVAKSGLCASSEMESPRGSLRIRHLIGSPSSNQDEDQARFPRLDQCAHFHYDQVDLPPLQVSLYNEELKSLGCDTPASKCYAVQVRSHAVSWLLRRSYDNFKLLDQQLHRCVYDRRFSVLPCLPDEEGDDQANVLQLLERYLSRFSQIAGNLINCGPVLNWLELDNRGRRLLVPDNDSCPINTPAVAAAYSVRRYSAQAGDEISFEVGDMISVIDMPPPEESVWWRGKRGFQVGFFPGSCVAVIGDKLPRSLLLPASVATLTQGCEPSKPVLRKHGKLIAFFRSFILARPSRRRLKQSGILKERVFGCDLGEHLLNSGHQVPMVLKCCAEFIESHGIVDGIYRLSGVTSNIQKLRNAFDEDRVPALYEDEAILQDIHSVASLLKMYFRELPNPLCTYQLYHAFVGAVGAAPELKLIRMREAVAKLPPPHYRTLEYLMRHLARVAERGHMTGMTPRNVAIVWAPNLLRCKELEVGGVAALQGVGIQAVVTEFLVCYADLIFCDNLPVVTTLPPILASPKRCRPKSLAISTPTKLLSLEEARTRALNTNSKGDMDYIEVGGGPSQLPAKYHTVIELPRKRSSAKRSPLGWKSLFGKSGRKNSVRKSSTPTELGLHHETAATETDLAAGRRRLRPVKSAESLDSGSTATGPDAADRSEGGDSPPSARQSQASLTRAGHNRSASHDSYFDGLEGTPAHARLGTRPSRLQEMDNEDVSSSLDLSEIQLNFDLEDSEMRIFSEDETLVSTSVGSGSLVSHSSPRVRGRTLALVSSAAKRLPPPRARAEESACPSLDPSPKKQKTCAASPAVSPSDSTRSKRSRLEERLASSTGELRFIDSQSPDNNNTVTVRAEVHPTSSYSLSDTESYDPVLLYTALVDRDSNCSTSSPSPLTTPSNPLYQPLTPSSPSSLTLACPTTVSQSSSTDIPYNRLSAPNLTPNSSLSGGNVTPTAHHNNNNSHESGPTPEENVFRYENVPFESSRRPDYENVPTVPAYQNLPADRIFIDVRTSSSPLDSPVKEVSPLPSPVNDTMSAYQNVLTEKIFIGTNLSPLSSPVREVSPLLSPVKDPSPLGSPINDTMSAYQNVLTEKIFIRTNVSPLLSPVKDASPLASPVNDTMSAYQNLPADAIFIRTNLSPLSSPVKESLITIKYENVKSPRCLPSVDGRFAYDTAATGGRTEGGVYQNLPADSRGDEHIYEDVELPADAPVATQGGEVVYQQVKLLRRSVHEVNSLLAGDPPYGDCATETPGVGGGGSPESGGCDTTSDESSDETSGEMLASRPHDRSEVTGDGSPTPERSRASPDWSREVPSPEAGRDSLEEVRDSLEEARDSLEEARGSGEEARDSSPDCSRTGLSPEKVRDSRLDWRREVPSPEAARDSPEEARDSGQSAGSPVGARDSGEAAMDSGEPSRDSRPIWSRQVPSPEGVRDSPEAARDSGQSAGSPVGARDSGEGARDSSSDWSRRVPSPEAARDSGEGTRDSGQSAGSPVGARDSGEGVRDSSSDWSRRVPSPEAARDSGEGARDSGQSAGSSPAHSADEPEQSRRRIESEIGRDILRERRTCQELEEVRGWSLGAAHRPGSIRDLLSRFETSPTDPDGPATPKPPRRYNEAGSLPPCVRARAAKTARRLANSTALSVSLDGGQFAATATGDDENRLARVLTSPDIAPGAGAAPGGGGGGVLRPLNAIDDDPQRRERIERYKEERRLFLREKYRSESFRGEGGDGALARLKQRAGRGAEEGGRGRSNSLRGCEGEGGETTLERAKGADMTAAGRGNKGEEDRPSNQRRDRHSSGSPEKRVGDEKRVIGPPGGSDGPITCVLVKERTGSDRMTVTMGFKRGGGGQTRARLASNPESPSPRPAAARPTSIEATPADRSWRVRPEVRSPDKTAQPWAGKTARPVAAPQPPPPSTDPPAPRRRSSGSASPSYCIRDMAAIFESRGAAEGARGPARPPPGGNKQYLSSM